MNVGLSVGQLTTLNNDTYFDEMKSAEWFVQVWGGPGGSRFVVARFYGATPEEARDRATFYVNAMRGGEGGVKS